VEAQCSILKKVGVYKIFYYLINVTNVINYVTVKALIALERYNDILLDRRIAKKCVHNYRLIEYFAMYKNKDLPKIKQL